MPVRACCEALQDQGYAFAKVEGPVAYEKPDARELDVIYTVTTGKTAHFGTIEVTGLQRTQRASVLSRLGMHSGDPYSAAAIDKARRNLLAMGVFGTVAVSTARRRPIRTRSVPVTFRVTERKRHGVNLLGAYSSDLGGSGTVTWTDNNVFGHAERSSISRRRSSIWVPAPPTAPGYDTGARLVLPEFHNPQQTLQFSLNALKQSLLLVYDQTARKPPASP